MVVTLMRGETHVAGAVGPRPRGSVYAVGELPLCPLTPTIGCGLRQEKPADSFDGASFRGLADTFRYRPTAGPGANSQVLLKSD